MKKDKLNINQIKGRIISDPVLKQFESGKTVLTFNFMYSTWQTTDSEGSHANFIFVDAWGRIAETFAEELYKGQEVILNGSFVQRRFLDKEGSKKSIFTFIADYISVIKPYEKKETESQQTEYSKIG